MQIMCTGREAVTFSRDRQQKAVDVRVSVFPESQGVQLLSLPLRVKPPKPQSRLVAGLFAVEKPAYHGLNRA